MQGPRGGGGGKWGGGGGGGGGGSSILDPSPPQFWGLKLPILDDELYSNGHFWAQRGGDPMAGRIPKMRGLALAGKPCKLHVFRLIRATKPCKIMFCGFELWTQNLVKYMVFGLPQPQNLVNYKSFSFLKARKHCKLHGFRLIRATKHCKIQGFGALKDTKHCKIHGFCLSKPQNLVKYKLLVL